MRQVVQETIHAQTIQSVTSELTGSRREPRRLLVFASRLPSLAVGASLVETFAVAVAWGPSE